jgi:SMC interacting uncharacterized protein involved in chromosome segregation
MFAPDVEARFKKIEDNLVVMAELQSRFEAKSDERIGHLEAVQNAMARWQDQMAERQSEFDVKMNVLVDAQIQTQQVIAEVGRKLEQLEANMDRLEASIDRFLKSRGNGGPGNGNPAA